MEHKDKRVLRVKCPKCGAETERFKSLEEAHCSVKECRGVKQELVFEIPSRKGMTHDEILKKMRERKAEMGMTNLQIELSTQGMLSQSSIAKILRGENVRMFTLFDLLDAMDFEMIIRRRYD